METLPSMINQSHFTQALADQETILKVRFDIFLSMCAQKRGRTKSGMSPSADVVNKYLYCSIRK